MKNKLIPFSCIMLGLFAFILFLLLIVSGGRSYAQPKQKTNKIKIKQNSRKTEISVLIEKQNQTTPIKNNKIDAGAFPPVFANYRRDLGFRKYAKLIERRGGVFLLYDASVKKLFRIHLHRGTLENWEASKLKNKFSSNMRSIEDEPALETYLQNRPGAEVLLAIPLNIENAIRNKITQTANSQGIDLRKISGFSAYYSSKGGSLFLNVEKAAFKGYGAKDFKASVML